MDLSNLITLWNFFIVSSYLIRADVVREGWLNGYEGQFTIVHRGRMLRVLMYFNHIEQSLCALRCVQHLRCKTYNYNKKKRDCELTDEEFDERNADTITLGWYNYATPSKVDGGWSRWESYTECTKTCGSGTREQYRECDSPRPVHGGSDCKGKIARRVKCNKHECPVNGQWSSWKNHSKCTKTCGDGTLEQRRRCDSPKPEYGGTDCKGSMIRIVKCNIQECPVINVALNKKATQSSTYSNNNKFAASKAVDGNSNSNTCSQLEANPWWEVDMGEARVIMDIQLNAVVTSSHNRGLIIETRKHQGESWILCKDLGDLTKKVTEFTCIEQLTEAQFLRIRSTRACHLYIYEIEVFGR